ncbi:DMT family transporter [Cocleimonas sp. KMM 6892]|jgi:drug/metabolite transporter (DMT)-like permease|uniref:DMT family transporter n=1 Tax=unclassified Cocleimonas TaxID=2639732 RepID=UPI002DB6A55C|nr:MULTISPECIES: DMT family transporter [unclassified Cocleimonas]MEB8434139.1 DMT family transporter [Cocleimonas sp. KMM 6892]MEC4717001.1 DMT family transporter [Cocleimonas sp. KMM 6895]MEC4746411.1 DMT family transporter [Cocleimonas sp. KMM 6896]
MQSHNIALGAFLIILAELAILATGMIIKTISTEVSIEQIVFIRNFVGLLILVPWLMRKGISRLHTKHIGLHIARSVVGLSAMVCLFYSWGHLPLAQASLLKQTSPIFIPIFAFFWIKESIGLKTIIAIIVGFLGVVLIINPGAGEFNLVVLLALVGAMLAGLAKVIIRKMTATETPGRIVFYFALIGTLVSAIPALLNWVSLSWIQLASLAGIAIFSTIGQLALSKAYSHAPAGQLGPYTYTAVAFAALFGWIIWDEVLDYKTIIGIIIIVFAGVLAMTDRRISRIKAEQKQIVFDKNK